jgi:hypothetical protein
VGEGYRAAEGDTPTDRLRLPVPEAARALGISPEAIRNRLSRGTLDSERESGTVYVDRDMVRHTDDISSDRPDESDALISEMHARIESLERQLEQEREANRENRRLLLAALERIPPQLEAPREAPEAPETVEEEPQRAEPRSYAPGAQEGVERPWWRRMFER